MIDYTVKLRISVPEGSGLEPFLEEFYAPLGVEVEVAEAKRETPGIAYGGPR